MRMLAMSLAFPGMAPRKPEREARRVSVRGDGVAEICDWVEAGVKWCFRVS
jgi:hypothetical protein